MKFKKITVILVAVTVLAAATGCKGSSSKSGSSSADDTPNVIEGPHILLVGQQGSFNVLPGFQAPVQVWKIVGPAGENLTADCTIPSPTNLLCTFDAAGDVRVQLNGKYRDGTAFAAKLDVLINDPGSIGKTVPVLAITVSDNDGTSFQVSTGTAGEGQVNAEPTNFHFTTAPGISYKMRVDSSNDVDFISADASGNASYTFTPGAHTALFVATDSASNLSTSLNRVFYARNPACTDLVVDPTKIVITPLAEENYYSYDARNAVTGGNGSGYQYKWDYNGDGVFDKVYDPGTVFVPLEYAIYGNWSQPPADSSGTGTVAAALAVYDPVCFILRTVFLDKVTPPHYLNVIRTDGDPSHLQGPQKAGYYFLGGAVQGLNGFQLPGANNDIFVTQKLISTMPTDHIFLDYQKVRTDSNSAPTDHVSSPTAIFHIQGMSNYSGSPVRHGLEFWTGPFSDLQATTPVGGDTIPTDWVVKDQYVGTMRYYTDGEEDGRQASTFALDGKTPCNWSAHFHVDAASTPCSAGSGTNTYVITIDGTFGPCVLINAQKASMKIDKGAFFDQRSNINACPGGTAGGGGGQPPVPR